MSLITAAQQHLANVLPKLEAGEKAFRESAWKRMESTGLPKRGTETWKYTSIAPLDMMNWIIPKGGKRPTLPTETSAWLKAQAAEFDCAVFVNGEYSPDLSKLPSEVQVSPARLADSGFTGEDGFADLSLATARPGLTFKILKSLKRPLMIVKYQDNQDGWISAYNRIEIESRVEVALAEVFIGGEAPYLRSDLMQVDVKESAHLHWLRRQSESAAAFHFSETRVQLAGNSHLHFTQLNRGSHWLRGQVFVDLMGQGADAFVHGLSFGGEHQHLDQRIVVSHHAGESSSSQLFKGVFKDHAKGVLNGKIYIAPNAQKVASQQMNHNLLLSPTAEANTKPELEIFADDVKANHGATVGRLDEEKMFYLRSRAIPADMAERILGEAFVADVVMKIPNPHLRKLAEAENVS